MWNHLKRKIFPQGLYWRALLIILVPMFLLQGVLASVFMERHFDKVTRSLSGGLTNTIAGVIKWDEDTAGQQRKLITTIANSKLNLGVRFMPNTKLPAPSSEYDDFLDEVLTTEIDRQIPHPHSVNTATKNNLIEINIQLRDGALLHITARRSQAYAANAHIFLVWMVGTALILATIAILFMRNQIRPIEALAKAAEAFGRGQDVGDFRPRGAREVRRAGNAFLRMKVRIEKQMEQRTNMFNGMSHDLRTVLTRFQLQLAVLPKSQDIKDLEHDVHDMQHMLEAYLAFARGDSGEQADTVELSAFLEGIVQESARSGHDITLMPCPKTHITLRPQAMKRCLHNLINNATRFAHHVEISVELDDADVIIHVDDNGKGIAEDKFAAVLKPFYKIEGHDQSEGGSGLGLAIAHDIATSHGGDLTLTRSSLGGLRVSVRVPL